jgi:NTE family protein
VNAPFVPPAFRPYEAFFGNRNFFVPRSDFWNWPSWTYFYDTTPLRKTLTDLVNLEALADKKQTPELLVSATDVTGGEIAYFSSGDKGLTLDHVLASGSLPPAFPMTTLRVGSEDHSFWDGGLFDNTPLGEVLKHMANTPTRHDAMTAFRNPAFLRSALRHAFRRNIHSDFRHRPFPATRPTGADNLWPPTTAW